MTTLTVTEARFASLLDEHPILFLDFWATWCGPCKAFAPVFEAAAARHPDIAFGTVDTDEEQHLANSFGIRSVPTLMAIRDGIIVFRESGALSSASMEKVVEQVRLLDMDDLRAEIAAMEGDADAIDH